jgi:hypothetical protein
VAGKSSKAPGAGKRSGRIFLAHSRDELLKMVKELEPLEPRLSWRTRTALLILLTNIIDQLPPKRDTRVKRLPWQIAMLAAALVDERNAKPKAARIAAIQTFAPEKADDAKFRAFIERTYSRLRDGNNPARSQLLPVPPEVLAIAREKLPKR